MSGGAVCRTHPHDSPHHVVTLRRCNYSAFNGYHYIRSDYSQVRCLETGDVWRSKAAYVDRLADMGERAAFEEIERRRMGRRYLASLRSATRP